MKGNWKGNWHIELLGRLRGVRGEETVTHFRTQKTASLLAFLAYYAGVPQPREELVERFWHEFDYEQARMSLRTALSSLRKIFGDALVTDNLIATLHVTTDIQAFERALKEAGKGQVEQLQEAVGVYTGPLLPGFYDNWVLEERERLAAQYTASLSALSRWYDGLGKGTAAMEYARRAAVADPLSEDVRADLIRLLLKARRPQDALRQYADLERVLEEQVGVAPQASVRALVAGISSREAEKTGKIGEEITPPRCIITLPTTLGRFRGRQAERANLVQRLSGGKQDAQGVRLFTLVGIGGIGKTRLATEVARLLAAHHFFTATHFVPLANAITVEQIWDSFLTALSLPSTASENPLETLAHYCQTHAPVLLIVDNVEQALPDAALIIESLLGVAPNLTVLATSRQRLSSPAEELIAVGALSTNDGVQLFTDRARAVAPEFALNPANEPVVREIAILLEGSPLAIELAAAWASTHTPTEMRDQLQQSVLNLPSDPRKSERHASLTATLDWSLRLLEPTLRETLLRLAVFRGGFDTDAASTVCGATRHALANLRDRSLVQGHLDTVPRFALHNAVQEFAETQWTRAERVAILKTHCTYYTDLAARAAPYLNGNEQAGWLAQLATEHDNLRHALRHAPPAGALTLVCHLADFWYYRGHYREGLVNLESALTRTNANTNLARRAEALRGMTLLSSLGSDLTAAQRWAEQFLTLQQRRNDLFGVMDALYFHKTIAQKQGNLEEAARYLQETLALARQLDDALMLTTCLYGAAGLAYVQGKFVEAEGFAEQFLLQAKTPLYQGQALLLLGNILVQQDRFSEAQARYTEGLKIAEAADWQQHQALTFLGLGRLHYRQRDFPAAQTHYESAQTLAEGMGDWNAQVESLGCLSELAVAQEDWAMAWQHCQLVARLLERAGAKLESKPWFRERMMAILKSGGDVLDEKLSASEAFAQLSDLPVTP
jgi:predicted ATPase/DNA-binding SARP family transcriptional activator